MIQPIEPDPDLVALSAKLWPDSTKLRAEWLRAVAVVRSTTRGWVRDMQCRVQRLEAPRER